jgi:hypothetical protein
MGLTTMFLREWRNGRRKKLRAEFEQATPASVSLADLPMAGARWRRDPDGSWMRWSYLGESWEAQTAPPVLIHAAEQTPGEIYWTVATDGVWKPYDPDHPPTQQAEAPAEQIERKPVEQLPPPSAPKADPDLAPRPEWTSDWKPAWTDDHRKY